MDPKTFAAAAVQSAAQLALPGLPFWAARSFWLTLLTIAVPAANLGGLDLLGLLGATDPSEGARMLESAALTVLPAVTGGLAWLERRSPGRRLTLY